MFHIFLEVQIIIRALSLKHAKEEGAVRQSVLSPAPLGRHVIKIGEVFLAVIGMLCDFAMQLDRVHVWS